jgi:hypothetical protein
MWNKKWLIISVINGATNGLEKNLGDIRGNPSIDPQEKTAVLRTADKRRKVLQSGT